MTLPRTTAAALLAAAGCAHGGLHYPESPRSDASDELHGVRVADPYRWLEDAKAPAVQSWMDAQDQLARGFLSGLPRRAQILDRLRELSYLDELGGPVRRGARLFYSRRLATKEKAIVCVREASGEERVLLDPNGWSQDGSTSLGSWSPSWDGKLVAYGVRRNNSDEATLHLLEVDALAERPDRIEGAKYAFASWTPDGGGFYYTWIPTDPAIAASERPGLQTVKFHKLGEAPAQDAVILEPLRDATRFQRVRLSKDGHWLVLHLAHGWSSDEIKLRDARVPDSPWVQVAAGGLAHYRVEVYRDRLYIETDEGAPRGRIFVADAADPGREKWRELVPEHATDTLDGNHLVGGKLSLHYLHDVASRLELRDLEGKLHREQKLPGLGTSTALFGDQDQDEGFYFFTSLVTPTELYKTSITSGETSLYFHLQAPVDPALYEVEEQFFNSKDGTRIPIWIARKKGAPRDGSAPALLTGYGGFLVSNAPQFNPTAVAWLDQGGVYAIANLRGGGEYGEEWHKAGMLLRKQNVFDDFAAAAQHLIAQRWTSPARLAILGRSNGGLLVGAAETQHPELFRAVLCGVPLLDMIRYQKFGSGKTWTSEYGSIDDADQFRALHAYSPYHHVIPGTPYPATLFFSADSDDRVDPMHARKMAAALQHASSGGPVLLRIQRHAGHAGADQVKAQIEQNAELLAFALAEIAR
jgi:prolyl oligopeptidase